MQLPLFALHTTLQICNLNTNDMGKNMQESCLEWFLAHSYRNWTKTLSFLTPWTARRKSWHPTEIRRFFFRKGVSFISIFRFHDRSPGLLSGDEEPLPGLAANILSNRSSEGPAAKMAWQKNAKNRRWSSEVPDPYSPINFISSSFDLFI